MAAYNVVLQYCKVQVGQFGWVHGQPLSKHLKPDFSLGWDAPTLTK